jgi:peptidoglycan hydrolase CwlO-like protein
MNETSLLDLIIKLGGPVAALVATYVAMSIRPLASRIKNVETVLEQHRIVLHNHEKFRARVEVWLAQNVTDHSDIKDDMRVLLKDVKAINTSINKEK